MPWKSISIMENRREFVRLAERGGVSIAELCRRGYAGRIVLSHDAACHIDWFAPGARERSHPRWHFHHIHDEVLPALRERGVTDAQIETMLVANPRGYFTKPSALHR